MTIKNKNILSIAGKTTDERVVVKNVFTLVGTYGITLDVVLEYFKENDLLIDWCDYIEGAMKDGANIRSIKAKIYEMVGGVYDPPYRDEIMKRIVYFFG